MEEAVIHEVMSRIPPALRIIIYKCSVEAAECKEGAQSIWALIAT